MSLRDIAAISSVGLDHQETLGKSLTAIESKRQDFQARAASGHRAAARRVTIGL